MTHWKAGWARAGDGMETVPLVLCLPGEKNFEGAAIDNAKLVDCPACVKILKQCKVI